MGLPYTKAPLGRHVRSLVRFPISAPRSPSPFLFVFQRRGLRAVAHPRGRHGPDDLLSNPSFGVAPLKNKKNNLGGVQAINRSPLRGLGWSANAWKRRGCDQCMPKAMVGNAGDVLAPLRGAKRRGVLIRRSFPLLPRTTTGYRLSTLRVDLNAPAVTLQSQQQ
jgi:hypothetical protein